jgi:hypothetical protein
MGRPRATSREFKKLNKSKWGLYKWRVSKQEIRKIRKERLSQ